MESLTVFESDNLLIQKVVLLIQMIKSLTIRKKLSMIIRISLTIISRTRIWIRQIILWLQKIHLLISILWLLPRHLRLKITSSKSLHPKKWLNIDTTLRILIEKCLKTQLLNILKNRKLYNLYWMCQETLMLRNMILKEFMNHQQKISMTLMKNTILNKNLYLTENSILKEINLQSHSQLFEIHTMNQKVDMTLLTFENQLNHH